MGVTHRIAFRSRGTLQNDAVIVSTVIDTLVWRVLASYTEVGRTAQSLGIPSNSG